MIQIYLRVLYGTRNKQQLFAHTTLIDLFLKPCQRVFTARYGLSLYSNSVLFICFVWISEQTAIVYHKEFPVAFSKSYRGVFTALCETRP
jgi:hypothetical protein